MLEFFLKCLQVYLNEKYPVVTSTRLLAQDTFVQPQKNPASKSDAQKPP